MARCGALVQQSLGQDHHNEEKEHHGCPRPSLLVQQTQERRQLLGLQQPLGLVQEQWPLLLPRLPSSPCKLAGQSLQCLHMNMTMCKHAASEVAAAVGCLLLLALPDPVAAPPVPCSLVCSAFCSASSLPLAVVGCPAAAAA